MCVVVFVVVCLCLCCIVLVVCVCFGLNRCAMFVSFCVVCALYDCCVGAH